MFVIVFKNAFLYKNMIIVVIVLWLWLWLLLKMLFMPKCIKIILDDNDNNKRFRLTFNF